MSIKLRNDGKTPMLSNFPIELRNAIKANQMIHEDALVARFTEVISKEKPTLSEVQSILNDQSNALFLRGIKANITVKADGSFDKKSLPKPLKMAYKNVEAYKRNELTRKITEKLARTTILTDSELITLSEMNKKIKNPFIGIFG